MRDRRRPSIRINGLSPIVLSAALLVAGCAHKPVCGEAPPAAVSGEVHGDVVALATSVDQRATILLKYRSIANLECWADQGDRLAQYALGRAYERGEAGVTPNRDQAIHYYRQAAKAIPNRTFVYSPPVGKESYGRVIPVTVGPPSPGLPEAEEALKRLESTPK